MMKSLEAKREQLQQLEEQRIKALHEAEELWEKIEPLRSAIADHDLEMHFKDGLSFKTILALPWTRLDHSQKWYRKVSNWISQHSGIYSSGYYPDTGQGGISITLDKEIPWQEQRSIEQVYPHLLPLKDGFVRISILEHTCSEFGSYYLRVTTPDSTLKIILCCMTYGHERELQSFTSWEDALEHIHKNHWS